MRIYMILFDIIGNLSTQMFDRLTVVFTMQSFTYEIIKHPSMIRIKNYRIHQTGKKNLLGDMMKKDWKLTRMVNVKVNLTISKLVCLNNKNYITSLEERNFIFHKKKTKIDYYV